MGASIPLTLDYSKFIYIFVNYIFANQNQKHYICNVNVRIENIGLLEMYSIGVTTNAEYSKIDSMVVKAFVNTVNKIKAIPNINFLKAYNGLRYEKLSKDLTGFISLRVNDQWRLICKSNEVDNTLTITDIAIHKLSKHYGK